MGGRACSCCSSPDTASISKAIASGESFRDIASQFGVHFTSVGRHAQRCLKVRRKEQKSATIPEAIDRYSASRIDPHDPQTLISTTARLVDEALSLLENAKKADDRRTALVALREARDGLALLMKVAGLLQPDGGVVIDARRQTLIANVAELSVEELRALAAGRANTTENF
jgi:hypothetical protein